MTKIRGKMKDLTIIGKLMEKEFRHIHIRVQQNEFDAIDTAHKKFQKEFGAKISLNYFLLNMIKNKIKGERK